MSLPKATSMYCSLPQHRSPTVFRRNVRPLVNESFRTRYYDRPHGRLVYVGSRATPAMWDHLWTAAEETVRNAVKPGRGTRWLVRMTRRFVAPEDGLILEGGC